MRCLLRPLTRLGAERGLKALSQYACNGCHLIPGVTGADVHVGPPLAGLARRQLIAGEIANTPHNMVRWLRNPQSVDPLTAMPDLGITQRDARDMAAYLATLLWARRLLSATINSEKTYERDTACVVAYVRFSSALVRRAGR